MPAEPGLHPVRFGPRPVARSGLAASDRVKLALHRLPWPLAGRLAALGGYAYWLRRPERRAEARDAVARLLAGTPRAPDDRLARRWLADRALANEYLWHPRAAGRARVAGREHLAAARRGGRGVLVSAVHLGPSSSLKLSVAGDLAGGWTVVGRWLAEERSGGYRGRIVEQAREVARLSGLRAVTPGHGSFAGIAAELRRGAAVLVHLDVPGSVAATFAGRPLAFSSGTAALALATGVPVVPVSYGRDGTGFAVRYHRPLDPADHDDAAALTQALVDLHGATILDEPETLVEPHGIAMWAAPATRPHAAAACGRGARPGASPW